MVFSEGLVDCTSEKELSAKLAILETRWADVEDSNPGVRQGFFTWFCEHKVETVKSNMLRPVREKAGLGCPPQAFTTNASETINSNALSTTSQANYSTLLLNSRMLLTNKKKKLKGQ